MKVVFIVPSFNIADNFDNLVLSIESQQNENWECVIIDDMSTDNTWSMISTLCKNNKKFTGIRNKLKKYALNNIVGVARGYEKNESYIIAVIDGDDQLCNNKTVDILIDAYASGFEVVWTAHKWDINGMNISKKMPVNVNPYQWPWCSSHLRTFKSSLLAKIDDKNFKNTKGEWFKRGYDQALMLPLLSLTKNRKYLSDVCYLYNIDSVSIPGVDRDWAEMEQLSTFNLVRSRGFLSVSSQ